MDGGREGPSQGCGEHARPPSKGFEFIGGALLARVATSNQHCVFSDKSCAWGGLGFEYVEVNIVFVSSVLLFFVMGIGPFLLN